VRICCDEPQVVKRFGVQSLISIDDVLEFVPHRLDLVKRIPVTTYYSWMPCRFCLVYRKPLELSMSMQYGRCVKVYRHTYSVKFTFLGTRVTCSMYSSEDRFESLRCFSIETIVPEYADQGHTAY
jgi:hypothetical protein